jgi:hypothetical protein
MTAGHCRYHNHKARTVIDAIPELLEGHYLMNFISILGITSAVESTLNQILASVNIYSSFLPSCMLQNGKEFQLLRNNALDLRWRTM